MVRGRLWFGVGALGSLLLCIALLPTVAQAAQSTDFSLQVTPSPLVTTVKPGIKTQVQLRIRNGGNGSE
ncbi:MAG TPA: hypothetical protein VLE99_05020, partial [Candidatus Saccharimonadales bacterium]|nr:hypothetical protein [Candidatus Saccharimonadales bacterium]